MRIESDHYINFNAHLVNKIEVGKLTNRKLMSYSPYNVSFIKMDPSNPNDINTLKNCSSYWEYGNLAVNIYYAACALKNKSKYYKNHEVYALTTQNADFQYPDSRQILGLVHVCPYFDGSTFIEQIQTNTQYLPNTLMALNYPPDFKGIGTGILNSLKRLTDKITCFPARTQSTINFYIRNGFNKHPNLMNCYLWEKSADI